VLFWFIGAPNDNEGNLSVIALSRCEAAYSEFCKNRERKLICTGGLGTHFNITSTPHAYYLKQYLMTKGVPEANFLPLVESRYTFEDALLSKSVIEEFGIRSVILVTSEFHLPRAKLIFCGVFSKIMFSYLAAITPLPYEELLELEKHEFQVLERERGNLLTLSDLIK